MLHQAASCKLHSAAARMKINASVGGGGGGGGHVCFYGSRNPPFHVRS